jgi:hypothetical protein
MSSMKYWEIIADKLSKAGVSLGWVSALSMIMGTVWIVDAHREGKRFQGLLPGVPILALSARNEGDF